MGNGEMLIEGSQMFPRKSHQSRPAPPDIGGAMAGELSDSSISIYLSSIYIFRWGCTIKYYYQASIDMGI